MTGHACRPYRGKRLFDLVALVVLAIPALVVGAVCAAAVKLTSPGPVFFRQERVGMHGTVFTVYKFRTMVAGDNPIFPDAARITPIGSTLRRLSLDELPQLINVALGDMSIVGPRPTLRYQVERYTPRQRHRLCIRPGITGHAQVSGRNLLYWADRIELDLDYVDQQSPWRDLLILGRTAGAMLAGAGVEGHPEDDPLARPPGE